MAVKPVGAVGDVVFEQTRQAGNPDLVLIYGEQPGPSFHRLKAPC